MNKDSNEWRIDCDFYGKPRCRHYDECTHTYGDCIRWSDKDFIRENQEIKENCATDDYINRGEAMEAILGEVPEAHYPAWYADKIAKVPSVRICPLKRWLNKILESWIKEDNKNGDLQER